MADNIDVTPGTGATIRAVEKSSIKAQVVVLDFGGAGTENLSGSMPVSGSITINSGSVNLLGTSPISGSVVISSGSIYVLANEVHLGSVGGSAVEVELTIASAAAAYASGDIIGAELTIAGAARVNGGTGKITGITLSDYALQNVQGELWITGSPVVEPADNAAWSISDAESATVVTVVPFALYYSSALNGIAPMGNLSLPFKCLSGIKDLYCCFVTRGAPTYIANGLHLKIFIDQD